MLKKEVYQRCKWLLRDVTHSLGFTPITKGCSGTRILNYHGIDLHGSTKYNSRFISQSYFEEQISYFSTHFNIVSLDDIFTGRIKKSELNIALTFDDGYLNNLKYALPILEQFNAPATFFITGARDFGADILWPDLVDLATACSSEPIMIEGKVFQKNIRGEFAHNGTTLKKAAKKENWSYKLAMIHELNKSVSFKDRSNLLDYWQQLTIDDIRQLAASPIATIGSHGYYHNNLGEIEFNSALQELQNSKRFLESITQEEITAIAYPDGSYSREIVEAAFEIGYTQQLALDYLFPTDGKDTRIRERFGMNPYISWNNQLHCMIHNSYW